MILKSRNLHRQVHLFPQVAIGGRKSCHTVPKRKDTTPPHAEALAKFFYEVETVTMNHFQPQLQTAAPEQAQATAAFRGTLRGALAHMPTGTPQAITDHVRAVYSKTPTELGEAFCVMSQELRDNGNVNNGGIGPVMTIVNVGNRCHLFHGLHPIPDEVPRPRGSPFVGKKLLMCLGDRKDDTECSILSPVTAAKVFSTMKSKLANYNDATNAAPPEDDPPNQGLQPFRGAPVQEFLPFVPLFGREICEQVIEGLYPADPANVWSYSQLAYGLKDYVASVTDNNTRAELQSSIMGLVTQKGQIKTAGSLNIKTPTVLPAAVRTWAIEHISKILNPMPAYDANQAGNPATGVTHQSGSPAPVAGSTSATGDPHQPVRQMLQCQLG